MQYNVFCKLDIQSTTCVQEHTICRRTQLLQECKLGKNTIKV